MDRNVLFSAQRNEGPFLLEWLAYHLVVGFDRIVILSNDCTDGSDHLLDCLARHLPLQHVVQTVEGPNAPQHQAQHKAREAGLLKPGDWACWLDADEFLNIHAGTGHVGDLRAAMGAADGICLNWQLFGAAGQRHWPGRQLDPVFSRCGPPLGKSVQFCKTLFRLTDEIEFLAIHRPVLQLGVARDRPVWLRGDGRRLDATFVHDRLPKGLPPSRVPGFPSYRLGQINHYAVRTPDLYALRATRGDGSVARVDPDRIARRYTARHYRRYDRNWFRDATIQRHAGAVAARVSHLLALPDVAAAHDACRVAAGLEPETWNR